MLPKNFHRAIKFVLIISALAGFAQTTTLAKQLRRVPTQIRQSELDNPPRIEDTLAVAKSPFEPVTLAHSVADARHNEPSKESSFAILLDTTKSLEESTSLDNEEAIKRTTRAAQDAGDQQQDNSSTTKVMEESTAPQEQGETSTKSIQDESNGPSSTASPATTTTVEPTETDSTITTDSAVEEEETTTTAPAAATTTTTPEPTAATTESPTTTTTTTTTTAPPTTTTTTELPTTAKPEETTEPPATTTTTTTTEAPAAEVIRQQTTTAQPTTTTTELVATTKVDESGKEAADNVDDKTTPASNEATTTGATAEPPSVSVTENNEQENKESKPEPAGEKPLSADREQPVEAPAIVTEAPEPPPPPPSTTTTTTTTAPEVPTTPKELPSTTVKPIVSQPNRPVCNHLPTYESDEVQKVFREETTFKNGTIKGKFTYINFDQRYRLVHYTRLPYGPVKIDYVEELGRPEQANPSQSTPISPNEIPNAVLQLRNILPNSLFGFPFTGPNSGQMRPPLGIGPRDGLVPQGPNSDDNSNMYFYSTDSISTPNLLTPTVPVSLLPRQKSNLAQANANSPAADAIGQSFLEQHNQQQPVVATKHQPAPALALPPPATAAAADRPLSPVLADNKPKEFPAPSSRFQYADLPTNQQNEQNKNLVYTYLTQAPGPQYQYSPVPMLQSLHHLHRHHQQGQLNVGVPTPSAQARALFTGPTYPSAYPTHSFDGDFKRPIEFHPEQPHHPLNSHTSYHHQPHSHEHFGAPFMFSQQQQPTVASGGEPSLIGSPKVRLRVKTSKSLNHNSDGVHGGTKSAQLRLQSQAHSTHSTSPAQALRMHQRQQRLGKQNHELRSAPSSSSAVNTSPVVYHVMRSPQSQVYSLPQYGNQNYAVAYDQNNQ